MGVLASGVLAAESAAAALQEDGDHRASSLPLFPITEFLAREFQGLSHGRMGRSHQKLHFHLQIVYTILSPLFLI